jgi:hypothetical protein
LPRIVFAGPSIFGLPEAALAGLTLLPPAACGDVARAVQGGAAAIGLIDGVFEAAPSVWHKELLWALHQGVRLYGASSMGALRAAETEPYGMCGIGRIFRLYRRGAILDDDEVAVLHGPAESGFMPLTEAMVNIRYTLRRAVRQGVVTSAAAAATAAVAKGVFYKDRTYSHVLEHLRGEGGGREAERLRPWLKENSRNVKREDAALLLAELQRCSPTRLEAPAPVPFPRTTFWDAFEARQLR